MILSIDLGTTNWKAALVSPEGEMAELFSMPTPVMKEQGQPCYDPWAMPGHLQALLDGFSPALLAQVELITLTGMAEAGLLLSRKSLTPLSTIWPWFDRRTLPLYDRIKNDALFDRTAATGLPGSFKYGIFKLLTLLEKVQQPLEDLLWAGLVSYAASLLTGQVCEDETLAARTLCLDIHTRRWDKEFLQALGLWEANFPQLTAPGSCAGVTQAPMWGLRAGIPVAICGHDHLCAAHAVDALARGDCFLSTGTAQVMLRACAAADTSTGLSYGPSPAGQKYACLGSIQSAGGSINHWKNKLYPGEDYDVLMAEACAVRDTEVLYYPYLAGRGAPGLEPHARAAFLGLGTDVTRGEMIFAVYAGIALETRRVLLRMGMPARLTCMGGLTRHERYMQLLADVTGLAAGVPGMDEGTLYGAARLGCQRTLGAELPPLKPEKTWLPNPENHARWVRRYERRYAPLMELTKWEDYHG